VVLVFRSRRGVDSIVNGKFTLGADASVAAGPVGRNANSSTDAQLKAEIYSYSRSRGLFAGVALDGAVLSIDHDANASVYGPDTTARMIFEGRVAGAPDEVVEFRDRLEEITAD
jgi:lipid-binding SYLF domain-containing protein